MEEKNTQSNQYIFYIYEVHGIPYTYNVWIVIFHFFFNTNHSVYLYTKYLFLGI